MFAADPPPPPAIVEVLVAPDGSAGDELGRSVSVAGAFVVGGRWLADPGGLVNAGAARIWRQTANGFVAEGEVTAPDAAPNDEFGVSVGVSAGCDLGDPRDASSWPRLVVGAWTADLPGKTDAGAAYVFRRDPADGAWAFETKLVASDSAAGSEFGRSVAIEGDRIVVGAWKHQQSRGALYVYRLDGAGWTQEAKLLASDGAFGDGLGVSVAIDETRLIAGAWGDDIGAASNRGSAYVFRRDGGAWTQEAKLVASDGASGDEFGRGVAIDGERAIVGSWPFFIDGPGAAYVFARTGTAWSQEAKLAHPAPSASDSFGFSVAISGDVALVGAWADDVEGTTNQGSAHLFRRDAGSWSHAHELVRADAQPSAYFGFSVALDGGLAAVGSRLEDIGANTNQGSVSVVCIDPDDCLACPAPTLPGDLDGDGAVGAADLAILLGGWSTPKADLDGDGTTGASDLALLLGNWTG